MIRGNLVKGLPHFRNPDEVCAQCISSKHSRTLFSTSTHRALNVLELVHMDICGPLNPQTLGGKRYFFLIVDDFFEIHVGSFTQRKIKSSRTV